MSSDRQKYKAINFDLDSNTLKRYFPKSTREPYNLIKKHLLNNGFEHRQYSGYRSIEPMSYSKVNKIITNLSSELPWLRESVKKFDVTDIGANYDLKNKIKNAPIIEIKSKSSEKKSLKDVIKEATIKSSSQKELLPKHQVKHQQAEL